MRDKKKTVVVTGFGPFGEHNVNASWVAVQELQRIGLKDDIELVVKEVPVIYDAVDTTVPALWKDYDPVLMVHTGVSSVASELTLEQQGHNKGYNKPDVASKIPETKNFHCIVDGPDCILSHVNMAVVCDEVNRSENCPVKAVVSYNAGRYLCGYVYYLSLYHSSESSVFIHVPPLRQPYTGKQLAEGLRLAILSMLHQIEERDAKS
ncbi:pyroglutamyl-peptidase 1-like [Diadema setosum]|uniref:pyroglutamyl-peptidase 1-like n=1 Tax=Diadema setosum TaxID=31175 RepID=UPI003B3B6697